MVLAGQPASARCSIGQRVEKQQFPPWHSARSACQAQAPPEPASVSWLRSTQTMRPPTCCWATAPPNCCDAASAMCTGVGVMRLLPLAADSAGMQLLAAEAGAGMGPTGSAVMRRGCLGAPAEGAAAALLPAAAAVAGGAAGPPMGSGTMRRGGLAGAGAGASEGLPGSVPYCLWAGLSAER